MATTPYIYQVPFPHRPTCPLSPKRDYKDISNLNKHMKTVHSHHLTFQCKYCGYGPETQKNINSHRNRCMVYDEADHGRITAPLPPKPIRRAPIRQSSPSTLPPTTDRVSDRTRSKSTSRSRESSVAAAPPTSAAIQDPTSLLQSIMEDLEVPPLSEPSTREPSPFDNNFDDAHVTDQPPQLQPEDFFSPLSSINPTATPVITTSSLPIFQVYQRNPDEISIPELDTSHDSVDFTLPSSSLPTNAWGQRFQACEDALGLEQLYDEYTVFIQGRGKTPPSSPTSSSGQQPAAMTQSSVPQPTSSQPPRHISQPANPPNGQAYRPRKQFDIKAAKKIQHLYRTNKKKAFTKITTAGPNEFCQIDAAIVAEHFNQVYAASDRQPTPPPPEVPRLEPVEGDSDPLSKPFSTLEVQDRLKFSKNTSPGPDAINYGMLKKADPSGLVLTIIFNTVLRLQHVPKAWNHSSTVLIHKKGDPDKISNWRPIALSNCISKLFASVLAHRLTTWAMLNNRLSKSQKGFLPFEGCLEHNFELQSIIQHARRTKTTALIAWLDLENAFGSVPHSTIFQNMELAGLHEDSINIIKLLYANCTTSIRCSTGPSPPIQIQSGVKQGCPLSPIVFNFAIDPVLRAIEHLNVGIPLHGRSHSVKGYADDLAAIATSKPALQRQLDAATTVSDWSGFRFNGKKCATLHIDGKKQKAVLSKFQIQGQQMEVLSEEQSYQHLGVPTGFKIQPSAAETIKQMTEEVKKIDASLLAPWQKFDAINTFVLSKLSFHLKGGMVPKKPLNELDNLIKRLGKGWLNLPKQASPEVLYLPHSRGGMNLLPTALFADVSQVSHAYRLLTSNDPATRQMAKDTMKDVVDKRLKKNSSPQEICHYYNGSFENISNNSNDYTSCWTRLRAATRRLKHKFDINWFTDENYDILLSINNFTAQRKIVEIQLKDAVRRHFLLNLLRKPDQGKVYEVVANSPISNHFMHDGNFTRFAEWRFIHRARLGVVPLNGCRRFGSDNNKRCRRCGAPNETLPHVLNHCNPHMVAITKRHDAILDRLIKATKLKSTQTLRKDLCVPGVVSTLRPDLVILDETEKLATIIDVCCPFENRHESFVVARQRKLDNYNDIKLQLEQQGFKVFLDAFVVGSLGTYDQQNFKCLIELGITKHYAQLMKKLIVSDTIKWSRNIYIEHITGQIQN